MSSLNNLLFDTTLQAIVDEVVAGVREDLVSDAYTLRETVAKNVCQLLEKEYPDKPAHVSVALTWNGVHSVFDVSAVIEWNELDKYVTSASAELNPKPESRPMLLAEVAKGIINKVFAKLIGDATLTLHQMILKAEEDIRSELVKHFDGLEEDFEVNITAGVGKDLSFRINVEDVRIGLAVDATIEYERYEEQEHPMQPKLQEETKESIDPAPITSAQKKRSEKTLILTMTANKAFTNAFLAHEQDRTAEEFAANIKLAVIKQLAEEFPADDYSVHAECTEDMVATVWVEAPGVTKIRLRGHRATQPTQQV